MDTSYGIRDTCTSTSAISKPPSMEPTGTGCFHYTRSPFISTVYDDSSGTTRFVPTGCGPITTQCYSCIFMATTEGSYDNTSTCCSWVWDGGHDASDFPHFVGLLSMARIHLHHQELLHSLVWELHLQGHRLLGSISGRIPSIQFGQHWKSDEEFYDNQKVNGLPLPRAIRSSSWSQLKDIEGCDPLTVPSQQIAVSRQ